MANNRDVKYSSKEALKQAGKLVAPTGTEYLAAIKALHHRRMTEGFSADHVEKDIAKAQATCTRLWQFCESPIEHMMVPWLVCQHYGQFSCGVPAAHVPKEDNVPPEAELMIVPQFAFARFRVDFAMVVKVRQHTKIIAVECDGRDYHKDAVRDFRRDLYLLGWGIPTVRATGSEIERDPKHVSERVARYVLDYACELGIAP